MHGFARRHRRTALATLAIAVLAWPFPTIVPGIDDDWNWVAGLAMATEQGFQFGSELVWTYGPLGQVTLGTGALIYFDGIALAAFFYQWIVQLLLAATVFLAARRSYPGLIAFAVAFAVVALVPDRPVVLGFAWCALALTCGDGTRGDAATRWFPAAIGALAGVMLLGKINHGVELTVLGAIALSTRPGRRNRDAVEFAGTLLATAAIGWLATGQALGDVWQYAINSVEIVRGYPAAMGLAQATSRDYAGAAIVFLLASALVWRAGRGAYGRARWGLGALWLTYAFFAFKAGFVRGDHTAIFSGNVLMALAIMPVRTDWRLFKLASIAVGVIVFAISAPYFQLGQTLNPYAHTRDLADQVRTLASGERRADARAQLASDIRQHYSLPPRLVEEIDSRTVAFWPRVLADLPYAYGFDWRPPPVLEPYSAYTPALDELGAEMLASRRAPERIVRSARPTINGRFATFEAPATTREIFCRYREMAQDGEWQLLARSSDRCGPPREIAVSTASWGESVDVPQTRRKGAAVLMRIDGANPAGTERVEALLLRPKSRYVHLDMRTYRLVAATAADGLLLSAPSESDYPAPFAMAPNPMYVAVSRGEGQPGGTLRYTFVELPISARRSRGPSGASRGPPHRFCNRGLDRGAAGAGCVPG